MKRADDHNPFNPTPELSSLQRHAAQQVADGLLELRGKAKGSELPGMLGPLEFAYYEACALANPDFELPEAVVQLRYAAPDLSPHKHWYYLGSCLAMYGNWFLCTLVGVMLGRSIPRLEHMGLEFAMAATFTGIVVPIDGGFSAYSGV